ncbi:MAG: LapA family protein [Cyanobacteriota bacterium]|nr:LapA family protein [Cyanobacteriota bacterium]
MRLFLVLAIAIAFLSTIFAFQNAVPVIVRLGVWQLEISLAYVLFITICLGIAIGLLVSIPTVIKHQRRAAKYKKTIAELESESSEHRETIFSQRQRIELLEQNITLE